MAAIGAAYGNQKVRSKKEELRSGCSGKESIDDALIRKRGDAARIGETGTGDELVQHFGTARVSSKPIIAKLSLDKFDFPFAKQTFCSRKYVRLESINIDLKIIDAIDLMSDRYFIERIHFDFHRGSPVVRNHRRGVVSAVSIDKKILSP